MGSRYFITGVQIGIIRALLETYSRVDLLRIMDLLNEIEDKQFIGDTEYLKKLLEINESYNDIKRERGL